MANLKRQALGEAISLGSLNDARTDSFIALSILKNQAPSEAIDETDIHKTDAKFIKSRTNYEKLSNMNISANLSASFLSGMVSVDGSGSYLNNTCNSKKVMESSLLYNITTKSQKLNLGHSGLREALGLKLLKLSYATHVVVGIEWGANSIVTFRSTTSENNDTTKIEGHFKMGFEKLKLVKVAGGAEADIGDTEKEAMSSLEFTVFGDVLADDGTIPVDFESAIKYMRNVLRYINKANGGKGKPLVYTLLLIEALQYLGIDLEIEADSQYQNIGSSYLDRFVKLFDEIQDVERALNDYYAFISSHSTYVPKEHHRQVVDNRNAVRERQGLLRTEYAKLLKEIRSGEAKTESLTMLYKQFHERDDSVNQLADVTKDYTEKIDFIVTMVDKGARYLGDNGLAVGTELAKNDKEDAFIFYFTESGHQKSENWGDLLPVLLSLVRDEGSRALILLVEEGDKPSHTEPVIVQYRNGQKIVDDVYKERKLFVEKCVMRYDQDKLEHDVLERPMARRQTDVYGHTDDYVYCDCGRTPYSAYGLRCNSPKHGSAFARYKDSHLLNLLQTLEPFPELNILILGEMGLIPCSFSTQSVNKDDPEGRLIERKIEIGSSENEHDGTAGQSATQETTVYPFQLGNTTVRLIDTPGIGDTRGVEQDRRNMANILSVLTNFDKIHGIIILLKPNASRLTVVFRFCIKELLTHLHRDATRNMVFGFTNTRGSNYRPGDTFNPLEKLLGEYKNFNMGLYQRTVYCFGSESFRYLAAFTQGVDMGIRDEYSRSWKHSAAESRRLFHYFGTLTPHQVKNTLSLNNTRRTITQLTKPMAEIAQAIKASIAVNEDQASYIKHQTLSQDELKKKLKIQKVVLHASPLDRPRTVCGDKNCIDFRDAGDGSKKTFYKTLCHSPCYLKNVEPDAVGFPGLVYCAAFTDNRDRLCSKCHHQWQQHLHVLYELREEMVTVDDPTIQSAIDSKTITIIDVRAAIKKMEETIQEFHVEHKAIQLAAVDFSLFLKTNSIAPYNDAMIEYVALLIEREKDKVNVGGTTDGLRRLEASQREYKELIEVLETNIKIGHGHKVLTLDEVEARVKELFALKHYGEMLRKAVAVVDMTHSDTFSERPYRAFPRERGDTHDGFFPFLPPKKPQAAKVLAKGITNWASFARHFTLLSI
ncbi:hypothetical protein F4811DRAFT_566311 [Daldinia bambusicola]|nr:hypothetical protein F4811DRAFT_566311 [Daldinia bambusicola]